MLKKTVILLVLTGWSAFTCAARIDVHQVIASDFGGKESSKNNHNSRSEKQGTDQKLSGRPDFGDSFLKNHDKEFTGDKELGSDAHKHQRSDIGTGPVVGNGVVSNGISALPIPGSIWLLCTGLLGLIAYGKRYKYGS